MKIWGYSERGVMNALFYGIAFGRQKEKKLKILFDILCVDTTVKELQNAEIVIEPSLSKYYGSPDLIIFYGTNNSKVLFIEAKVKTSQKKEENFSGNIKADLQQERIKKLCFNIKILKEKHKDGENIIVELNKKGEPRIGDNLIVQNIISKIINTNLEPKFKQILPKTWKMIRKSFSRSILSKLEDVFLNNEGQIY
jgi:hypothetical protein